MGRRHGEIAGMRSGRLKAIRPTGERKHGRRVWECLCDCGGTAYVRSDLLTTGATRSCGCLKEERCRAGAERSRNIDRFEGTRVGMLRSKVRSDNRSGFKGVCRVPKGDRWRAYISLQGKRVHLGYFDTAEEAAEARAEAEERYFDPVIERYRAERGRGMPEG